MIRPANAFGQLKRAAVAACLAAAVSPASATADEAGWAAWDLLRQIEVKEVETPTSWHAEKTFPEELLRSTENFRITGYYMPVQAQAYVTQFLLVEDPADCPFCGTGGYGPTLEVELVTPLPDMAPGTEITVAGTLDLVEDPETFQTVRLIAAQAEQAN
ncbi:hypothetical protein [Litoreibacter roseus]|uniref:DUF3299 domain-containing protein n=1 Tax=Litoreibacter roseus TaxID=2601869 RepID=A0A6N6JIC2_9RHOB|nr:hypothetical protein [Litoreibacter roseus]GFE65825.1 hypothetical protein KIN_28990 [Litoreibacter roseus]